MRRVLFVGGGTGGHIVPLLAVMAEMSGVEMHYAGSARDMEFPAIRESPLAFERHVIRTGKLNRHLTWKHLPEGYNFLAGLGDAGRLVKRLRPDAVFCKGGAASVPVALAASRLGIPVFAHETDVASGLANRWVARYAQTIFTAFPVENYDFGSRGVYAGQPVRPVFRETDDAPLVVDGREIVADMPVVAVTGGSQGARGLNNLVHGAWRGLLQIARVVQVCGPHDIDALRAAREDLPEELRERLVLVPFLGAEFPRLIKRGDLVLSRSGGTIFELAAARKAAVLVPLPTAAQDHQRKNAAVLEKSGAAVVFGQDSGGDFLGTVRGLLEDDARRTELSRRIGEFDRPDAAKEMAAALTH